MPAVLPLTSASFPVRPRSMRGNCTCFGLTNLRIYGIGKSQNPIRQFVNPEVRKWLEAKLETELHASRLRRGRRLAEQARRHRPGVRGEVDAVEDVVGLGEEFEIEAAGRLLKAAAAARSALLLRPRRGGAEHERAGQPHGHVAQASRAARAV